MPSAGTESGTTRRTIGSRMSVTHNPVPVGFPTDAMPSRPRMALPWSCGEKRHSLGNRKTTANAASSVPAAARRTWERRSRNGPHTVSR